MPSLPVSVLMIYLGLATFPLAAQCSLSSAKQRQLDTLEQSRSHPAFHYQRGLIFESAGCLAEARDSFSASLSPAAAVPQAERDTLRTSASSMLQITQAELDLRAGNQTRAFPALWDVADNVALAIPLARAIQILSSALPPNDVDSWHRLQQLIDFKHFNDWRGLEPFLRQQRRIGQQRAAYETLNKQLSQHTQFQQGAGLQLVLLEFLVEDRRVPQALALYASLEPQFATLVLDPMARLRFLRAGAKLFSSRADPESAARARAYAQLAADYDRRLQNFY